jgi:hypothetical protein
MKGKVLSIVVIALFLAILIPNVANAESTFTVTVQEQGLPSNTQWTGYITNHTYTVSINTDAFEESFKLPNGTYEFYFNNTSSYAPLTSNGYFTVSNGSYSLIAQYVPINSNIAYTVDFKPVGLPTGQNWTLNINGTSYTSNKTIPVSLLSGKYTYSASSNGYGFNASSIFVTDNESVNVTFYKIQYPGIEGEINSMLESVFHISFTALMILVDIGIGLLLGFIVYRKSDNPILFVMPVFLMSLITTVIGIVPIWVFVIVLFGGIGSIGIGMVNREVSNE